jgi:tRNA-specific 2-thiouridylase
MKKKVFVGMSGGVDSSVSAYILKEQGYDVVGVFIKVWQPDFVECTWREDRLDAMRVASILDIPFVTLDLEKEYKQGVIDYMIEEYRKGRTPNPDVMCNREVKFGAFLSWAKDQDKDAYVATGHYASTDGETLIVSKDINKDQTYFLWTLKKELLPSIIFPIGQMEKSEVRDLASKIGLPVSTKKDSQGLCFVGTIDVKTLLKKYIEEKEGKVLNLAGEVIGTHTGVMFYTIGERHGFTITKKSTEDAPYFVISKDLEKNTITVSHVPPQEEKGEVISLDLVNWTKPIQQGDRYQARARYRAPYATIEVIDETHVKVIEGDITKTIGQSLVLYQNECCIGGGIIRK